MKTLAAAKAILIAILTTIAALIGFLLALGVLSSAAVEIPLLALGAAVVGGVLVYNFGFRGSGVPRKIIAGVAGLFCAASIIIFYDNEYGEDAVKRRNEYGQDVVKRRAATAEQEAKLAAKNAEVSRQVRERAEREAVELTAQKKREEAEIAALRKSNPDEYLARLKGKDVKLWEEEAKILRPKVYAAHVEEVRKQAETEVRKKVERDEYAQQEKSPKDYITLDMTWSKGGFDSVMIANFTIKSTLQFQVQDISIYCIGFGNSGTQLTNIDKTLYELLPAKTTKRFNNVSMGFIPSQMTKANCSVSGVKR